MTLFVVGACLCLGRSTGICAEKAAARWMARLNAVAPCPALVAAAEAKRIPLQGIDSPGEAGRLDPADSLSALVTLFETGGRQRQWLVHLQVVEPTAAERARKPAAPMILYSSFGGTQACVSVPAFVVVRTLGPFAGASGGTKAGRFGEKSGRFEMNKGFLGLGLHHAAAAFKALEEGPVRGTWTVRREPFSESEVAKGRESAAKLKLTDEKERALIGSIPALLSYFETVKNTPGLSEILFEVLDLPSAWSMLRNRGIRTIGFQFGKGVTEAKGGAWSLPDSAPVYHLPLFLDLNDHRALNLTLVVTSPNPPLLACAGVVGLLAEKPDDPNKYLTLRVLSARAGSRESSKPKVR